MQSGNVENPWLSAISSHFSYWASPDVALFILRALHHQDVRLGTGKEDASAAPPIRPSSSKANLEPILSPPTPSTPTSGMTASLSDLEARLSQGVAGPLSPQQKLPKGLSDPEDWW